MSETPETPPVLRLRMVLQGAFVPIWPVGYRLRLFSLEDAPALHALLRDSYAQGEGAAGSFDKWWPALREDSEFEESLCFLAVNDLDELAGAAQCWTSGFVKDLAVREAARTQGLATALLFEAFSEFRRRGLRQVDLKVRTGNAKALRLYRNLGMQEVA